MAGAAFWDLVGYGTGETVSDDPWDTVELDGKKMPGVCEVKGLAQLEVDQKKGKGRNGAALTISGYLPGPFEIVCTVWTPDQWTHLQRILDDVWNDPPKKSVQKTTTKVTQVGQNADGTPINTTSTVKVAVPSKERVSFSVRHPALQALKITACIVQGVTFPEPGSVVGTRVVRFKCIEFRKPDPKPATKTANAPAPPVVPKIRNQDQPLNFTPLKPSAEPTKLGPKGVPAAPASGSV
jgi:hypothetical protein